MTVDGETVTAEIRRTEFDTMAASNAISARGLPGRRVSGGDGPDGEARPVMPAPPPRVVVTGMGAVSALGNDVASTWDGLVAGRSGVRTIERFDPARVASKIAAEVRDFDASGVLDRKDQRRTDRYIQFGLVAGREALDQAGLPGRMEGALAERTGVILGSGLGGVTTLFDNVLVMAERGPDRISPFFIPMGIANVGAGQVAIAFGPLGPNFATVRPAPRGRTRSARRGRRSAAATPTSCSPAASRPRSTRPSSADLPP